MPLSAYFTGQLLLAMPGMTDPRFHKSVIFLCLHDDKGAMGLVINAPVPALHFGPLMEQLDILPEQSMAHAFRDRPVFNGGPVEPSRGFLLHDDRYFGPDTIRIGEQFSITGTTDGLKDIGQRGDNLSTRFILGYAGWSAGQLEKELQENAWMTMPPTTGLVFDTAPAVQWESAYGLLGINPAVLSAASGHA